MNRTYGLSTRKTPIEAGSRNFERIFVLMFFASPVDFGILIRRAPRAESAVNKPSVPVNRKAGMKGNGMGRKGNRIKKAGRK